MTTTRPYRKALDVREAMRPPRRTPRARSSTNDLVAAFIDGIEHDADPPLPGDRRRDSRAGPLAKGRLMRRSRVSAALLVGLLACSGAAAAPAAAGVLPVAVNDSYTAVHGKLKTVGAPGVLGNDIQLGSGFKAKRVNDVDNGTLDLNADGGFTYRSKPTFVGTDTFTYRVDGGMLGLSNIATVTITVTNDAPVARPDAYSAVADVDKIRPAPGCPGQRRRCGWR